MKLYELATLGIIATFLIGVITGVFAENDKDILPNKQEEAGE